VADKLLTAWIDRDKLDLEDDERQEPAGE